MFSDRAQDITPPEMRGSARLLMVPAFRDASLQRLMRSMLSPEERQQARRFSAYDERLRFEQRKAFQRWCVSRATGLRSTPAGLRLQRTADGQPYVPDLPTLRISFASCSAGLVGCWSSTHEVGVDIEETNRLTAAGDLAATFFTPAEAEAIAISGRGASRAFARLWSLKEAALKSVGKGLPAGLDSFQFDLRNPAAPLRVPRDLSGRLKFRSQLIDFENHVVALVTATAIENRPVALSPETAECWRRAAPASPR